MRRSCGLLAVAVMVVGSGMARAQFVDPSTGIPVDPTTDPMDFANAMSGQPTNVGMEAAAYAMSQAQAATAQAQASTQAAIEAMNQTSAFAANAANNNDSAPARPAAARTPNPLMTPNGGSFKGSVQVAIADKDANAMIHYTVDGSKPTEGSPVYVAPLTVTAKTKVRAIAVGSGGMDSGVVTKTFKVKS